MDLDTLIRHAAPHEMPVSIRSAWSEQRAILRGRLTDKQINKYEREGYYSEELRQARRDMAARKKQKQERREGNFVERDGRMIFAPK